LWDTAPRSDTAAAVSVADKLDTIVGMFAIGEVPTGSADPYGIRRLGNGVIRALVERELPLSLAKACAQARSGYDPALPSDPAPALAVFFRERLAFYLAEAAGFAPSIAAAVLAAGADQPLDVARRARALAGIADTAAVAAVVKRARSIVRKEKWESRQFDPARLAAPAGQVLHAAVAALPEDGDYAAELTAIAALAAPLDRFFNEVRVNDPDPAVRANRLGFLAWVVDRLSRVADFSELATG
ncbi:MAG: glycine--tRNA ligase subunit beta, partial [Terriglobales bacterium]